MPGFTPPPPPAITPEDVWTYATRVLTNLSDVRAAKIDEITKLERVQKGAQATTAILAVVGSPIIDAEPFKVTALLSLHNMTAGETFLVTEDIRDQDDSAWREYFRKTFSGVQTSPHVWFESKPCQGWRIRIQRTGGVDRDVTFQFFKEEKA